MKPIAIIKSLIVMADLTWIAFVNGLCINPSCPANCILEVLNEDSFLELISLLQASYCCSGNSDAHFITLCKQRNGKFVN